MARGLTFNQLFRRVNERAKANGKEFKHSRVKASLRKGVPQIAKKLGEEGVEAALAGAVESKPRLIAELADLQYQMTLLMVARKVTPEDVALELGRRTFDRSPK